MDMKRLPAIILAAVSSIGLLNDPASACSRMWIMLWLDMSPAVEKQASSGLGRAIIEGRNASSMTAGLMFHSSSTTIRS